MDLSDSDKRRLRDALSVKSSLNGNLMTFVGLEEVKARYPEMWEHHRERIVATSRTILRQFTDPVADIVLPVGEANFVVLFTRLGRDEAMLRAAAIKAEILRRFIGDEALADLAVETQAVDLDSGSVTKGVLGDLLAMASAGVTSAAGTQTAGDEAAAAVRDGRERPSNRHRIDRAPVAEIGADATVSVDDLEARFGFRLDDLEFAFQPLLYAKRGVFSIFECRAVRYSATRDILSGYGVLPRDASGDQVVALDQMTLMRARHGLVDMAVRKRVAVVAVPVSFETMTSRASASEYLEALQRIPSDLRNYLVMDVRRCPPGVPEGRLAEIVSPLKRVARAVFVNVTSAQQPLSVIKNAGAFGAGIALSARDAGDMANPTFLGRFCTMAHKLGLQAYVLDVDTPVQATRCRKAGFDYLAGRALAELSDYVGPVTEMSLA
jgi:hypothetical protein